MSKPKVALVSGFWAQNIGNAFFNVGGKYILDTVFGSGQVQFVQDRPPYRTFYKQEKGDQNNAYRIHENLDVEYLVLQGPMLTKNFFHIWGEAFKALKGRGVKVLLIGAAFFKYTSEEVSAVEQFLKLYPPYLISTRDSESFQILEKLNLGCPVHDGVDSAFFVPHVHLPLKLRDPYYCFTFDRFPEPNLRAIHESVVEGADVIDVGSETLALTVPVIQNFFSHKGKSAAYFGHLMDMRKLPSDIGGVQIIRPEHRYTPHMTHKIYQHPNAIVSDEVFTYLSLYAHTELTLSDRVHACVMTLAYGNPARLFTPSPRKRLFSRLGLSDISNRVVSLDLEYLEEERQEEMDFLKEHLS